MNSLESLHELQYGQTERVLLFTQDPSGLGSQVHRRVIGMKLALMLNRKVVFPKQDDPPYKQIFQPVHSKFDYAAAWEKAADYYSENSDNKNIIRLDFHDMWKDPDLRGRLLSFVTPECRGAFDEILYCDGMILSFLQLTPEHARYVAESADKLHVNEETLGLHIRRGDKSAEAPYVPIELYNEKIREICARRGMKSIFACSDDPNIFSKLIVPSGVELICDRNEPRYNNANHRFLRRHPELALQETQTGVKNIYLLSRCGAVIGQDTAQFGRLAAAQICFRNGGLNYGYLLDGRYVVRRSMARAFLNSTRLKLRAAARALFPWVTLKHTKQKWYR